MVTGKKFSKQFCAGLPGRGVTVAGAKLPALWMARFVELETLTKWSTGLITPSLEGIRFKAGNEAHQVYH